MGIRFLYPEMAVTFLFSILLCRSPWLGQFSFEFSFALALFFFLLVTISGAIRLSKTKLGLQQKFHWLLSYLFLLIVPLVLVLIYSFKHGLCSFTSGLEWFLLLPTITLLFSFSCTVLAVSRSRSILITLLQSWGLPILFSFITVIDLYFSPQLSFYHPVVGYFPGPMYDEWIPTFASLYTYRFWILILSVWMFSSGSIQPKDWKKGILLFLPFAFRGDLGWQVSHSYIQKHMRQYISTASSDIYFSEENPTIDMFAKQIDTQIKTIRDYLHVDSSSKIKIYIYPDSVTKKRWTGTQHTLIGNPMQNSVHLLSSNIDDPILTHELTHVIAAPLGLPLLRISPKIGLLEGLATAIQKDELGLSVHEWSRVMQMDQQLPNIANTLHFFSFWKESPTRVYFASGSFVNWLITTYGIDKFKLVYKGESFDSVYQVQLPSLIASWEKFLQKFKVDPEKMKKARTFLQEKPFYQKHCVHEVAALWMKYSMCSTCGRKDCEDDLMKACALDLENVRLQKKCEAQRKN